MNAENILSNYDSIDHYSIDDYYSGYQKHQPFFSYLWTIG